VLVLPLAEPLATAAVYAEADRLGLQRPPAELRRRAEELGAALAGGTPLPAAAELLHNDLQRAAVSLCPPIAPVLVAARQAGAEHVLVSGSGPTVLGLFPPGTRGGQAAAAAAAGGLRAMIPRAAAAAPVGERFALPAGLSG
jgi:4-diphosphocytidyl-2C-methyl-D-erythritol kinase